MWVFFQLNIPTFMYKTLLHSLLFFLLLGCAASKQNLKKDYVFASKSGKNSYLNAYNKSLQLWQVPFKEENINTSLGRAHVIVSGPANGKAVVMLHGMDATSTMWFPNIKALTKNHRVYAIDFLMEVGKSQSVEKTLSKQEIITWYHEIFNHYQLKDFAVIGASKGGWLATLLASQKESKIDKLVLLSPAQTFMNIDKAGKASAALFLKAFPSRKKLEKTLTAFSYYPARIPEDYKRQFFLANKHAKKNSSFLQLQPYSDNELKTITIPVLVLVGDHDIINSSEALTRAQQLLPNSETKTITDAGHFLSIDQPQAVNKIMLDFLKK